MVAYSPTLPLLERLAALRSAVQAGVRDSSAPDCCGLPMFDVGMEIDDTGCTRLRVVTYECDACLRRCCCEDEVPLPDAGRGAHASDLITGGVA